MDRTPAAYNFPYKLKAGKKREIFSDYGLSAMFNVETGDNGTGLIGQKAEQANRAYHAIHPTLPTLDFPTEVPSPWSDRVMAETNKKNQMAEAFVQRVSLLMQKHKTTHKKVEVATFVDAVKSYSEDPKLLRTCMSTPWIHELVQQYIALCDTLELQRQNSVYAGGCLTSLQTPDGTVLVAPTGGNFDTIALHRVSERGEGLLRSAVMATEPVHGEIFGISGCEVQSQNTVAVRTGDSCLLYSLHNNDGGQLLLRPVKKAKLDNQFPTSINLSPYIPGEAVLTTNTGSCFLWADSLGDPVFTTSPRFAVSDSWSQASFGAHPREIIHADLTAVQLFDLRRASVQGLDLFALPSQLLQTEERIRACHVTSGRPFHVFVATDYSLILLDQRFPGHPVLQWDHMLNVPPQYMVAMDTLSDTDNEGAVFVGSQSPADVHAFRYTHKGDNPCQISSLPWRVAKISDICEWPQFMETLISPRALQDRLSASLVGLDVVPSPAGFTVFQVDSHGDIFHQVYQGGHQDKDVTLSAGSEKLVPHPDVVGVVRKWAETLEQQAKEAIQTAELFVVKDVSHVLEGIIYSGSLNIGCPLCLPSVGEAEWSQPPPDSFCNKCKHSLDAGRNIVEAVDRKRVIAPHALYCMPDLEMADVSSLPSNSSLSRLLLKHWTKDPDIDDILKDRDKEVLEYRKQRKKNKVKSMPGMDEDSILARLMGEGEPDGWDVDTTDRESTINGVETPVPGIGNADIETGLSREPNLNREPLVNMEPRLSRESRVNREPELNREPGLNREPELNSEPELNQEQVMNTEPLSNTEVGSQLPDDETGQNLSDGQGTSHCEESVDEVGVASDVPVTDSDLDLNLMKHTDFSMFSMFETPTSRHEETTKTPDRHRRKGKTKVLDCNDDSDVSETPDKHKGKGKRNVLDSAVDSDVSKNPDGHKEKSNKKLLDCSLNRDISATPDRHKRKRKTDVLDCIVDSDVSSLRSERSSKTESLEPDLFSLFKSMTRGENILATPSRHKRREADTSSCSRDSDVGSDVGSIDNVNQMPGLTDFNLFRWLHTNDSPSDVTNSGTRKRKRLSPHRSDSPCLPLSASLDMSGLETEISGKELQSDGTPLDRRKERRDRHSSGSSISSRTSSHSEVSKRTLKFYSGF